MSDMLVALYRLPEQDSGLEAKGSFRGDSQSHCPGEAAGAELGESPF